MTKKMTNKKLIRIFFWVVYTAFAPCRGIYIMSAGPADEAAAKSFLDEFSLHGLLGTG